MSTSRLQIIATMTAKPDKADALREMLPGAVARFRKEPGCEGYILLEDNKQPGRFLTYETWSGQDALDAHMHSPTMKELEPRLKGILAEELKQEFLTVLVSV